MSFRVEITEPAEQDAREAVRWIGQSSPEKASLWYFDFLEAADICSNFPLVVPSRLRAVKRESFATFSLKSIASSSRLRMKRSTFFTSDIKGNSRFRPMKFKAV